MSLHIDLEPNKKMVELFPTSEVLCPCLKTIVHLDGRWVKGGQSIHFQL